MKRKPITLSTIRNRYDAGSVRTLSAAVLLLLLLQLVTVTARATVWRVNSDPEISSADFRRLSDAQEAASPGDTLYVEGSVIGYGAFTLTKRLTLIGPGYLLEENQADTTRSNFLRATLGNFTINDGAEGAVVMGLEILGSTLIYADSVSILRNRIYNDDRRAHIYVENCKRVVIGQNRIRCYNYYSYVLDLYNCTNTHIFNNIIESFWTNRNGIYIRSNCDSIAFENNVVFTGNNSIYNTILTNNIWRQGNLTESIDYPNGYYNNLSYTSTFPDENGNQNNVDMNTVFTFSDQSPGKYYELKPGSPAIGAGRFGIDMGIFGGTDPYRLSGIAPLPTIIEVEVTEVGLPATQLDVTFKAKAND